MSTLKVFAWLAAATLCGCVAPLPVTGRARGYVRDAVTRRPLSAACVAVENHSETTALTASDGSFDLPAETHWRFIVPPMEPTPLPPTLIVTKAGYQPKTVRGSYEKREILLSPK